MKKLLMLFTALWLSLVSSYALENDVWIKKPSFSHIESKGCHRLHDCQNSQLHIKAVLHVNKRGKVTRVEGVNTGDRALDRHIVRAFKKARIKPVIKDGVALKGTATVPIHLRIANKPHKIKVDNSNVADLLRTICANDDNCDQNQLEGELAKRNL